MGGGGSNNNGSSSTTTSCGLFELLVFLAAIVSGTACSICSKTMMQLHGTGSTGLDEPFAKPLFQTFGMFVGMTFGLVMHGCVLYWKLPFPGYEHDNSDAAAAAATTTTAPYSDDRDNFLQKQVSSKTNYGAVSGAQERDGLLSSSNNDKQKKTTNTPVWMYFFLAIPSVFDLGATALCMMGLRYLDVSIYQLLRGSGIIFVALMKQHVLGDRLYNFQWTGVALNVISVVLVGATAILNTAAAAATAGDDSDVKPSTDTPGTAEALLGVLLVMVGAFVQALQFVFEEKVMSMDDASAPPLLLIGMEGLWGTILCVFVVYPLAYFLPGDDHGSYENPFNTFDMIVNSSTIQIAFCLYFFAIFAYNLFAVLVTFRLNSIWHAILDNFRPITVWGTDMFIYYAIVSLEGKFGEPWGKYSYVQLIGMVILLYGTAIYNAPNAGSVKLKGEWFALGLDLRHEYDEIETQQQEAAMHEEWERKAETFKTRKASSLAEHSPFISMHTQNMRGLASSGV